MEDQIMFNRFLISTVVLAWLCGPAFAAEQKQHLVNYQAMTTEVALQAAQAAMESCRGKGYQVSVAAVDRGGNVQVLLRDRFAGSHTSNTAIGKAATAVSFRTSTLELTELAKTGDIPPGVQNLPGIVIVGGGIKVEAAGSIIGGIGVSGSPSGAADEVCANAGVEAVQELIEF
jgi:uncharacterized protein GlcG (DUF336 family)